MKLDVPRFTERFGSVSLHGVQRVYELDSGHRNKNTKTESEIIRSIDDEIISKIEAEMAIVIPIKDRKSVV